MRQIRILHLLGGLPTGGTERRLLRVLKGIDRERFKSKVITILPPGKMFEAYRQSGTPIESLNIISPLNLTFMPQLISRIQDFNPDILNSFLFHANVTARLCRLFTKAPLIVSNEAGRYLESPARAFLYKVTVGMADRFLSVSEDLKKYLTDKCGIPESKIKVLYAGVDKPVEGGSREEIRESVGVSGNDFVVGCVGNLRKVKGHKYLIEGFGEFAKSRPDCHLVLLGEDRNEIDAAGLVSQLGLEKKVHFAGHRENVTDWLKAMDVMVLSSLSEGLPNVILEAYSCLCPVIATKVGGVPEIVKDDRTGILIDPADSGAIAAALVKAYKNRNEMAQMAQRGFELYKANHTTKRMIENMENFFISVLKEKGIEVE